MMSSLSFLLTCTKTEKNKSGGRRFKIKAAMCSAFFSGGQARTCGPQLVQGWARQLGSQASTRTRGLTYRREV